MHKESHQYVDLVEVMRPITKCNARVAQPQIIPEMVRKAFRAVIVGTWIDRGFGRLANARSQHRLRDLTPALDLVGSPRVGAVLDGGALQERVS